MKSLKVVLISLILMGMVNTSNAQFKDKFLRWWVETGVALRTTPWTFGLGWNIVDDNGNPWKKIFDVNKAWNLAPYPGSVRAEKDMTKGWSVMFNFDINQYYVGKIINSDRNTKSSLFMSFDLNAKYDFKHLFDFSSKIGFPPNQWDVYMASGFGYTSRNSNKVKGCGTFNIGFGTTAIFYKGWGMNLEAMSKLGYL